MNKLMNFSGLGRIGMMLVIAVVFAVTTIGVGEASAATGGVLKNMFPPGNKGASQGVGMIDGYDGNKYVFHIPGDNGGQELTEGDEIFFELGNGRKVHSVTQESSSPIGEAGPADSDEDGYGDSYTKMPPRDIDKPFLTPIEDGDDATTRKRPGRVKYGDITLERGIGQDLNGDGGLDRSIHTIGAGIVAEIVKGFLNDSPIVIELPMSKGTVKFFNESKSFGGKVIDILIKVNGNDV